MNNEFQSLDIVVPVYNEAPRIRHTIDALLVATEGKIIAVDDGSRDDSVDILSAISNPRFQLLRHTVNRGIGAALRTGFAATRGDVVVTMDADLSYSISHISRMLDALVEQGADMVLASAYMVGGTVDHVPPMRRHLSRAGNLYLAYCTGYRLRTFTCMVRAWRGPVLRQLHLSEEGPEIQLEMLWQALDQGCRIIEIPAELCWAPADTARSRRIAVRQLFGQARRTLVWGKRLSERIRTLPR